MTLPLPNLDDRRFQDLVDEAKRLIAVHTPEWTNHNISDPGVTLIELFAYMTEQTLFRLNQVPDRLYTVFLNMVGIEPFPAHPARALLTFTITQQADDVHIPASTEVGTRSDASGQIVFVTDDALDLSQPKLMAALSVSPDGVATDQWDDLRFNNAAVTCFPNLEPGETFLLGFAEPLGSHVIQLTLEAGALGLGINPAEPPLVWEASTDEGWAEIAVHRDDSGGLNRNGAVDLAIPRRHDNFVMDGIDAYWVRVRLKAPKAGQRNYGASPQIRSLGVVTVGGQVWAHHGEPMPAELLGVSDGLPGQRFTLSRSPNLPRRSGETLRVVTAAGSQEWTEVEHFGASDPTDRHFVWHASTGEIELGPEVRDAANRMAQHGAIPPRGAQLEVTGYRVGGGSRGNVGRGTLRVLRTTIRFVDAVTNLGPASGGVDAETVQAAKERAPLTLRTGNRAVTTADFARLAREATGDVARSRCIDQRQGDARVRLLVVPDVRTPLHEQRLDDYALDEPLYRTLRDYLEPRRLIGTSVEIGTPYYEGVSIVVMVTPASDTDADALQLRILDTLYRLTNPILGGPAGDGVPFGWVLTADEVRQVVAVVPGVVAVGDVALFSADLRREARVGPARETIELDEDSLCLGYHHKVVLR